MSFQKRNVESDNKLPVYRNHNDWLCNWPSLSFAAVGSGIANAVKVGGEASKVRCTPMELLVQCKEH